jgi:hypothetical protein
VVKPLYSIPEAGNHWFKTYHSYYIDNLGMTQSTYDPCLLYRNEDNSFGVVGLQTDDTLFLTDETFTEAEHVELQKAQFIAKAREQLTAATPLKFNGGIYSTPPRRYHSYPRKAVHEPLYRQRETDREQRFKGSGANGAYS